MYHAVPTPEVVITGNSITPYNGTVFNLTGAIQMDMRIVNITATWEWSFGETMLMYQETITPPHESIFKFQPLASNSSGNYILRVTLTPLDNFLFVIENSITVVYNLSVLRKYSEFIHVEMQSQHDILYFTYSTALPPRPPSISVISRQSFPDDFCGEIMTLSCTTNPVEGLFTPPVITWIDPEGSEVPTGGNHDPSVESQTSYLVFSEVAANNIGLYKCRTVITIPEALIDNHFDESTISVTTSCEYKFYQTSFVFSFKLLQFLVRLKTLVVYQVHHQINSPLLGSSPHSKAVKYLTIELK